MEPIEERKSFTLHAGRQTGKTTSLMWLERHLNATGRCRAVWVDIETARETAEPELAFRTLLGRVGAPKAFVDFNKIQLLQPQGLGSCPVRPGEEDLAPRGEAVGEELLALALL